MQRWAGSRERRGAGPGRRVVGLASTLLSVAGLVAAESPARGGRSLAPTACNLGTTAFFDQSTRCVGAGRVPECETARIYRIKPWRYGTRQHLFISTWTSLNLYDITTAPSTPAIDFMLSANQPWGQMPPTSDWDDLQWDAAVADDYAYGIAMFQHYGWVSFQIDNPTAPTGLTVKKAVRLASPDTAARPKFARLFQGSNGQWYAVGSYLNGTSSAVSIVAMGADASNPTLVKTLGSSEIGSGDALESVKIAGQWWLFAKRVTGSVGVAVFSVSSAVSAAEVALVPGLASDFYVDQDSARLYVLMATSPRTIKVLDIANPAAPVLRSTITLQAGTYSYVAGDANVVVAAKLRPGVDPDPYMQAFSVVNAAAPVEIAAGELTFGYHADEQTGDMAVILASNGNSTIFRAAKSVGSATTISSSCLSSDPNPLFTLANQSAANATAAACGESDADGFSGDAFDIHDMSTGQIANGTVTIANESGQAVYGPVSWSPGATWTWATPTSQTPGVYTVTVSLLGQTGASFHATRTVRLCCGAPPVIAGPTETCVGNPVTLDAGDGYATYLWSPGGETTRSITVDPSATTGYSVSVTTAAGCAAGSELHTVTALPTPDPLTPVATAPVRVRAGVDYVVSWTATSASGSYELQEATDPLFAGAMTYAASGTSAVFGHAPLARTTYHYRVRAVELCGEVAYPSPWSEIVQVVVLTPGSATPAIYRSSDRSWYLRNSNSAGSADLVFPYGDPSDLAVRGDWDGDGAESVGVYRDGTFYLRNSNTPGDADVVFAFGLPGDLPVAGDWDGDGVDTVGVYRPGAAAWMLRNSNSAGPPDLAFTYGLADETPVVGDWDGDGIDTVGIFRVSDRQWYLHNTNGPGNAELVFPYGDPAVDVPVVGDWDGDGDDTVGIYRSALGEWFVRNSNTAGNADLNFVYGLVDEKPLAGNWDGI